MPKFPTFPLLFDSCRVLTIETLKRLKYLNDNSQTSGVINWNRNGEVVASISATTYISLNNSYLILDYKCNDKPINYRVQLVSMPSNLGKGKVWYFICPKTNKQCRKLYLVNSYFYSRFAFKGMYEKQTQSKKTRELEKTLGAYFSLDRIYEQKYKKHLKKTYAGKYTKKYYKILKQIEKGESMPIGTIERMMSN